jgi:hypothetical protein
MPKPQRASVEEPFHFLPNGEQLRGLDSVPIAAKSMYISEGRCAMLGQVVRCDRRVPP